MSGLKNSKPLVEDLGVGESGAYAWLGSGDNAVHTYRGELGNIIDRNFSGKGNFSAAGKAGLEELAKSEKLAQKALEGTQVYEKSANGKASIFSVYVNVSNIGHRCARTVEILTIAQLRAMVARGECKAVLLNTAGGGQGRTPFRTKEGSEGKPIGGLVFVIVAELETGNWFVLFIFSI